jgi:Ca2+-binding RTX toxin-like protein
MPLPTSWSSVTNVSLTYSQNIDALLYDTQWASSTITYSFPGYDSLWSTSSTTGYGPSSGSREAWSPYFAILSASDQDYFTNALQKWANVANLHFSLVADTPTNVGDIRAAYSYQTDQATEQAWAYYPANASYAGDMWINAVGTSAAKYWMSGSYEYMTILHELGHALGLKHPFEGSTVLPTSLDSRSYTIMSYSAQPGVTGTQFSFEPTTPMILDIQAIQYVYGANYGYHAGNDTYLYSDSTSYHETIWDGGGLDTIQYNGYWNSTIDLRQGYGSHIGSPIYVQSASGDTLNAVNNVWIAFGVTIENAFGGFGNDLLTGNDASNSLDGSGGADAMVGGDGSDTYCVDNVGDVVIETNATTSTGGSDTVFSYLSNYTLSSNVENGGVSSNIATNLTGNSLDNILYAGGGDNVLNGGSGRDTVAYSLAASAVTASLAVITAQATGGSGSDALISIENIVGSAYSDMLTGNSDSNRLMGDSGNDTINGGSGVDTAIYRSTLANYTLTKGASNYTVRDNAGTEGTDAIVNVERLRFSDIKLAIDLDGNAGLTAKILGAVFGAASVSNKEYVGIGLSYLDDGMSYQDLMQLALNAKLGAGFSNAAEVNLLYQNLAGVLPSAADLNYWTGTLSSGQFSQASLAVMAAELGLNATNINLVGLHQSGIEYV